MSWLTCQLILNEIIFMTEVFDCSLAMKNFCEKCILEPRKIMPLVIVSEAGATFDNSFFDNSFGFLRQFKNRSFLDPVFVHATGPV